jgi:hypothetical protein
MNKEQKIEEIKKQLSGQLEEAERRMLTELLEKLEGSSSQVQTALPPSWEDDMVKLATLIQASGGMDDDEVRRIA